MNALSLIPFGLRLIDKQFVDVSVVKRGSQCGCICPSCETPLIARQGDINEWHFAHASKGVFSNTKNKCEYSFWVSVTLMAKQIIKSAYSIQLPPLTMFSDEAVEVKIAHQKEIQLEDVQIEQTVNSIKVDATLKLKGYLIGIIFSSPNRPNKYCASQIPKSDNVGILEVSLEDAAKWLFGCSHQGEYTKVLESNILKNNDCKKWHYHPRQAVIEKQQNTILSHEYPTSPRKEVYPVKEKEYKCVMCGNIWLGTHNCSNCKTHLYSIVMLNS